MLAATLALRQVPGLRRAEAATAAQAGEGEHFQQFHLIPSFLIPSFLIPSFLIPSLSRDEG